MVIKFLTISQTFRESNERKCMNDRRNANRGREKKNPNKINRTPYSFHESICDFTNNINYWHLL